MIDLLFMQLGSCPVAMIKVSKFEENGKDRDFILHEPISPSGSWLLKLTWSKSIITDDGHDINCGKVSELFVKKKIAKNGCDHEYISRVLAQEKIIQQLVMSSTILLSDQS